MLQLMKTHLAGYEPLQNIILMYCLGTETAVIMKPLCFIAEDKRQSESNDQATAWRYYKPEIELTESRNLIRSFLGWVISEEYKGFKIKDPIVRENQFHQVKLYYKTQFNIRQLELKAEETNGTPSGIVIRKYMKSWHKKGLTLMDNESMWAKFSGGVLLKKNKERFTTKEMNKEVCEDLTKAMNELNTMKKLEYRRRLLEMYS